MKMLDLLLNKYFYCKHFILAAKPSFLLELVTLVRRRILGFSLKIKSFHDELLSNNRSIDYCWLFLTI